MRILAAALGALLISTSQPALALGAHEQDELPQSEAQPAEAPQPDELQADAPPAETPQPIMQQTEAQPAEAQPAETPQPDMQRAEALPTEAPQPSMQPAEMHALIQQPEATQGVATPAESQQMRQAAAPQVEPPQEALAAMPQATLPGDVKWTVFAELKYGTRLDVPSAVFATPDGVADRGVGRQFKTPDGRATLAVYSQRNDARDTPASYLRKNLKSPRAELDMSV